MHGPRADEQKLEDELNDPQAIEEIMTALGVDEQEAREIWRKFIDTVRKLRDNLAQ